MWISFFSSLALFFYPHPFGFCVVFLFLETGVGWRNWAGWWRCRWGERWVKTGSLRKSL